MAPGPAAGLSPPSLSPKDDWPLREGGAVGESHLPLIIPKQTSLISQSSRLLDMTSNV